jgi:hypothetical protein
MKKDTVPVSGIRKCDSHGYVMKRTKEDRLMDFLTNLWGNRDIPEWQTARRIHNYVTRYYKQNKIPSKD